jgi:hypothetical protein
MRPGRGAAFAGLLIGPSKHRTHERRTIKSTCGRGELLPRAWRGGFYASRTSVACCCRLSPNRAFVAASDDEDRSLENRGFFLDAARCAAAFWGAGKHNGGEGSGHQGYRCGSPTVTQRRLTMRPCHLIGCAHSGAENGEVR